MRHHIEPILGGRLAGTYPASEHDVELRVDDVPVAELQALLGQVADEFLAMEPECRKVVFAAPAGDLPIVAAAEAAGFRYVVDVDVLDEKSGTLELSLLVREPAHVTRVDRDLDQVPEH